MLRIFLGYDSRAALQYHVLAHSIVKRASAPVAITPLVLNTLPITRRGLTEFTTSRWLVPWLCGYRDYALFMDSDIVCLCDVAELFAFADPDKAVSVVQHEGRLAFERASLMLFNNALCTQLTPERIQQDPSSLPAFTWCAPDEIGSIPRKYNFLVEYEKPYETGRPSIIHYTAGIPAWPETRGCDYAKEWLDEYNDMRSIVPWSSLMANSVHAKHVYERLSRERAQREPASSA